jgi:thymidylate synthase
MKEYFDLINAIQKDGEFTGDRTGMGTQSLFGYQYRIDLRKGFPLLTSKKMNYKKIFLDMLWMLSGSTNVKDLHKDGVHIWDSWATEDGNLGPIYGKLWRRWSAGRVKTDSRFCPENMETTLSISTRVIDQISTVIEKIKKFSNSRALIVTAWDPDTVPDESVSPQENVRQGRQSLASCQTLFQFKVYGNHLDLQLYQRSADCMLGVPYNLAEYALLLHMVAQQCDLVPRFFIHSFGDAHIYNHHRETVAYQLTREHDLYDLPTLVIKRKPESIFKYTLDDFEIIDYECHQAIEFKVAV